MRSSYTASDLIEGYEYRIVREFRDFDGIEHRVDDQWIFRSKSFLPYDDGLSLFVETDGVERQIRLQWRPETQSEIIECFHEYAEETHKSEQGAGGNGGQAR
jgi:hypothetical protein